MLVYHPMFDPYHCALRLTCVLVDSKAKQIEWDRLRLLDFFVVFPHLLSRIRLPRNLFPKRKIIQSIPPPYEFLPEPHRLFYQLNEIQVPTARVLAAQGYIDPEALTQGTVTLVKTNDLSSKLDNFETPISFRTTNWYSIIVNDLSAYPLNGKDGLKDRAGIMEFHHDSL
jgi:hypothetical protein